MGADATECAIYATLVTRKLLGINHNVTTAGTWSAKHKLGGASGPLTDVDMVGNAARLQLPTVTAVSS